MFLLHLIFIPRINFALDEFKGAFNEHKIRTARNWSPNQLWINGMMNINNPLSHGELDEYPQNLELYGEDPQGPTPFQDSAIAQNGCADPDDHMETPIFFLVAIVTNRIATVVEIETSSTLVLSRRSWRSSGDQVMMENLMETTSAAIITIEMISCSL